MNIPFNKPFLTGKETQYITEAVNSGHIAGNGMFTRKCQVFLENRLEVNKCRLTTSCTDALEMAALLMELKEGDEVIMPSYTFVSTANAFLLRGVTIKFGDCYPNSPNIDPKSIASLITNKTKVIVVVHYAGIACAMDEIMQLAKQHHLYVVEDAAHAIASYYKGRPLGSIGDFGTLSFHETKNIIAGEGGALLINNEKFSEQVDIVWEKGTNRSEFFRGEANKYEWKGLGSSFYPSDITAAYLFAQLENLDQIQGKRGAIWQRYCDELLFLEDEGRIRLPFIPAYATNNMHMFYFVCSSGKERDALLGYLSRLQIKAVFHYTPLHKSSFFSSQYVGRELINCDLFSDCLIRLPFFYELKEEEQMKVIEGVKGFYK